MWRPEKRGNEESNLNQAKKRHMRRFHPEEYATFFPDKPDAKVRHTATGLAALEGTAGTDLEAEMEACVIRMAPELAAAAHRTEDSTMKGGGIGVQAIHEVEKGMRKDVGKDLEKDVGDEVTRADATRRNEDIIRHENTPEHALTVEEGPVEDWTEECVERYYWCLKCRLGQDYHLSIVDYSRELPEWMVRDRIPILKQVGERKCLTCATMTSGQRNRGISELYWVTLEQPKSGATRKIWVPDIAIKYVYDEPMGGLKRFNALNS